MKKKTFLFIGIILLILSLSTNSIAWNPAVRLTWSPGPTQQPIIALNSFDKIFVLFRETASGNGELFFRKSLDGGVTWSPIKRLTWNLGRISGQAMAVDSANAIHIVWSDNTPGNYEIYYKQSLNAGATWTPPTRICYTPGNSVSPQIATDAGSNVYIVWGDNSAGNNELMFKKSTDGGITWSGFKRMTWNPTTSQTPRICTDTANNIHLIWNEEFPPMSEIYYRNSPDGGITWSQIKRLTWNPGFSHFPNIKTDASNNINIVWEDNTPGNYEIFFKRSTDGGMTFSPPKRLTWNPLNSYEAMIAVESPTIIHLVWVNLLATGFGELYYRNTPDGGNTWSPLTRLTYTPGDSYYADIYLDSLNKTHVVWTDDSPGNADIFFKKKK